MSATLVYDTSPVNRRARSTKAEMAEFRQAVWDLAYDYQPLTGRQLYYRAVVRGLIDKDQGTSRANESRIQRATDYMREEGIRHGIYGDSAYSDEFWAIYKPFLDCGSDSGWDYTCRELAIMPFEWLSDNTRTRYQATQYPDAEQALQEMHRFYRRDLWRAQPRHVEVWCESDALGDVLMNVTYEYGLALLPCRGQAGKRFIFDSAESYSAIDKPVVVLYVGDFDPAGLDIRHSLHERMCRYGAPNVDFRWLAVTPEQVASQALVGHGINTNTPASVLARFYAECDRVGIARESVEAEAMEPDVLCDLLRDEIASLIDPELWGQEKEVEKGERTILGRFAAEGLSSR